MEPGRYLLVGLLTIGVLAGLVYRFGSPGNSTSDGRPNDENKPKQSLSDFTLKETRGGGEVWRLRAPRATRLSGTVKMRSPHVVYSVNGDTRVTIDAKQGIYRINKRILTVSEDVVLKRIPRNQVLRTKKLKWNRNSQVVRTPKQVRLETPEGVLTAQGMKTRLEEDTVQFLSNVKFMSR